MKTYRRAAGMRGFTTPGPSAIGESWTEVREYCARLRRSIALLLKDAYAQIVYEDPAYAADKAEEWGSPADELEAQLLEARAKKRGPVQAKKDLEWAARFREFRLDWEQHDGEIVEIGFGSSPGYGPQTGWERTQVLEGRFRDLYWKFAQLGSTKPSEGIPQTFQTADGLPHDKSEIPWTGILVVGGIIGLATFSQSIVKLIRGN